VRVEGTIIITSFCQECIVLSVLTDDGVDDVRDDGVCDVVGHCYYFLEELSPLHCQTQFPVHQQLFQLHRRYP
jgi:hypothetical protein